MAFQELLKLDKEVKPVCLIPGIFKLSAFIKWQKSYFRDFDANKLKAPKEEIFFLLSCVNSSDK